MNNTTPQIPSKTKIYAYMQMAVDIVTQSPHPTSKVAATIAGKDSNGNPYTISRTNHWPPIIATTLGTETKIGNSSGTIHAETACIFAAVQKGYKTLKASIFITDPPCPNCVKNMAEAGISALYIDHKGLDKDWMQRRKDSFTALSMRIAAKAGIDVYIIYRKEKRFEVISEHAQGYKPKEENPAIIEPCDNFAQAIKNAKDILGTEPFALAIATDQDSNSYSILTTCHPTIGYTQETLEEKTTKYSFILQPLNRLLMTAAKTGLKLDPKHIYSSRIPTSRELVNFVGNNPVGNTAQALYIGHEGASRDPDGPRALQVLKDHNIISIITNT